MWIELDETELQRELDPVSIHPKFFFFYTPLCGTCKLAHRMVSIVMETIPGLDVYACDLNRMPDRAMAWKIESIPCLATVKRGRLSSKMYAFHSVDHVYQTILTEQSP